MTLHSYHKWTIWWKGSGIFKCLQQKNDLSLYFNLHPLFHYEIDIHVLGNRQRAHRPIGFHAPFAPTLLILVPCVVFGISNATICPCFSVVVILLGIFLFAWNCYVLMVNTLSPEPNHFVGNSFPSAFVWENYLLFTLKWKLFNWHIRERSALVRVAAWCQNR